MGKSSRKAKKQSKKKDPSMVELETSSSSTENPSRMKKSMKEAIKDMRSKLTGKPKVDGSTFGTQPGFTVIGTPQGNLKSPPNQVSLDETRQTITDEGQDALSSVTDPDSLAKTASNESVDDNTKHDSNVEDDVAKSGSKHDSNIQDDVAKSGGKHDSTAEHDNIKLGGNDPLNDDTFSFNPITGKKIAGVNVPSTNTKQLKKPPPQAANTSTFVPQGNDDSFIANTANIGDRFKKQALKTIVGFADTVQLQQDVIVNQGPPVLLEPIERQYDRQNSHPSR